MNYDLDGDFSSDRHNVFEFLVGYVHLLVTDLTLLELHLAMHSGVNYIQDRLIVVKSWKKSRRRKMLKKLRYKIGVTKINTKGMANRLFLYFFLFKIRAPSMTIWRNSLKALFNFAIFNWQLTAEL